MSIVSPIENERSIFLNIFKSLNEMMVDRKYIQITTDATPVLYDLKQCDADFKRFTTGVQPQQQQQQQQEMQFSGDIGALQNSMDRVISEIKHQGESDEHKSYLIVSFHLGSSNKEFDNFITKYITNDLDKNDSKLKRIGTYDRKNKYIFIHRTSSRRNDGIPNINIFYYKHVSFNVLRHVKQPLFVLYRQSVETDKEKMNNFYQKYNLNPAKLQMSEMKITDPVSQWMGAQPNDIFLLYRNRDPILMISMYSLYKHIIDTNPDAIIDAEIEYRTVTRHSIKKGTKKRF